MTETTKTVFEKYQVRKSKKQKQAFREYVKGVATDNCWSYSEEAGYLGAKNIVVGDPQKAKVIYTAHYDTCARLPLPNFITPKSFIIYLLYQIVIVMVALSVMFALQAPFYLLRDYIITLALPEPAFSLAFWGTTLLTIAPCILIIYLMTAGPANKHTANDNTSGVTVLLNLITAITPEDREKAAFVFFDLEELGMFGSMKFASNHKDIAKNILLVNFDCVSDGDNIMFALRKGCGSEKLFKDSFQSNDKVKVEIATKGVFYPSDQVNFKRGVGVAALKRTKKFNILYMNRIHTRRDVIYREENIEFLCDGVQKMLQNF